MYSAVLCRPSFDCEEIVGIFFVWKKGRKQMRVIFDARRTNRRVRPSPPVSLVTAEGFANIGIDGDGGSEAGQLLVSQFAIAIAGRSALLALESMPLPRTLDRSMTRRRVFGSALHGPQTRQVFLGRSTMNSRRFPKRSSEGNGRKSPRGHGSLTSPSRVWRLVLCSAVCSEPLRRVMRVGGTF